MILATDSPVVIQPKPKPWMPISCFWLVSAPEKEEFLTAQFGKETLKLGTSVFSGLDGGNLNTKDYEYIYFFIFFPNFPK